MASEPLKIVLRVYAFTQNNWHDGGVRKMLRFNKNNPDKLFTQLTCLIQKFNVIFV